jgi:hypothetical protein
MLVSEKTIKNQLSSDVYRTLTLIFVEMFGQLAGFSAEV